MRSLSFLFATLFVLTATVASAQCGLFFSEYAEGSSNNKYLEIYNPTVRTSLLMVRFPSVGNAPTTPGSMNIGIHFRGALWLLVEYT